MKARRVANVCSKLPQRLHATSCFMILNLKGLVNFTIPKLLPSLDHYGIYPRAGLGIIFYKPHIASKLLEKENCCWSL